MAVWTGGYRLGDLDERRRMARQMAQAIEWLVFAYQGVTLLQTAWINLFPPFYRAIVLGLAAIHIALAGVVVVQRGLIGRTPSWIITWMFAAAAVPVALVVMAPHSGYAANDACVLACTYPAPVVLIVSLYPWVVGSLLLGQLAAPLLIAILLAEWLFLLHFLSGRFTPTAIQSVLVSVMWLVAAYGIGLALRRIVDVWLKDRNELEQENIDHFAGILHSHIKAGLTAVERESPDVEGMVVKVHDMQDVVGKLRLSLLLSKDQIQLAMICSERVRFFKDVINIKETPCFGARTVSQRVGRLVDRMLGDLLSNAAKHGAESVWIRFSPRDSELVFEILDDGPGFDDHILDDPDRSLHHLRAAAVDLGGGLTKQSREPRGSHLVLTVRDTQNGNESQSLRRHYRQANARDLHYPRPI